MRAAIKIEKIDFISNLIRVLIGTVIALVISTCAIGTAFIIININDGRYDLQAILLILICTILWIAILLIVLTRKKKFEYFDIQMTNSGDMMFKHQNVIYKFNIVNEYKKKNIRISSTEDKSTIILKVYKLNGNIRVTLVDSGDIKSKIQDIVNKYNLKIKIIQED